MTYKLREQLRGIYLVNPDGNQVKRLVSMQNLWRSPTWSPDGKQLAFMAGESVYSINADGTGLRTIFAAQSVLSSVLAVLVPCLIHAILVLGLFSPYVYEPLRKVRAGSFLV